MMICNFFTDFIRDGENIAVDDLEEICVHYIQGEFLIDLIPLVPFNAFLDNSMKKFYRLFFCVKVVRLKTGMDSFNISKIYTDVKNIFSDRLKQKINDHPEIASDMDNDHNNIET